ncbi:MAG: beta-propeller domain-containing protein [Oscillospiraceae bacterium]|jgi:uncharacterized secreted protein with C-terminal beta-propeller domain|nr:beta-propeller domain-containing protein [Oscillospiraceae bacterium]
MNIRQRLFPCCLALALTLTITAGGFALYGGNGGEGESGKPPGGGGYASKGYINVGGNRIFVDAIKESAPANVAAVGSLPKFASLTELLSYFDGNGAFVNYGYMGEYDDKVSDARNNAPLPPVSAPAAGSEDMGGGSAKGGSGGYSETNAQVDGVAEGDIVKTDGKYIYSLSWPGGAQITIIEINGADMGVVSRVTLPDGVGSEIYVSGDWLVTSGNRWEYFDKSASGPAAGDAVDGLMWFPSRGFTEYRVYDISDRSAPKETRVFTVEGDPVATRMIGSTLYFVCRKYNYYIPFDDMAEGDLLPIYRDTAAGGGYKTVPAEDISYFPGGTDCSYLFVGAIDVASLSPVNMESVVGAGWQTYMSSDSLYVAGNKWDGETNRSVTEIYRFAVSPEGVAFAAKGSVPGSLLNQYSMDEYRGVFRVATTDWADGTTHNAVYALDTGDMSVIGQTPGLAGGESIQSVRFMGDTAYVVTFLRVDPLFIIDMSDPRDIKVLSELKVPGFSTYLHPVGGGLLVGFGRDIAETYIKRGGEEVFVGTADVGMKVSLFDVSDPYNPKEIDVLSLGKNTYAEAEHNPRALMVDAARGLFGFSLYDWSASSGGQTTWRVVAARGGKLAQLANVSAGDGRLLYAGDYLYFVKYDAVIAYSYVTFEKLGAVAF